MGGLWRRGWYLGVSKICADSFGIALQAKPQNFKVEIYSGDVEQLHGLSKSDVNMVTWNSHSKNSVKRDPTWFQTFDKLISDEQLQDASKISVDLFGIVLRVQSKIQNSKVLRQHPLKEDTIIVYRFVCCSLIRICVFQTQMRLKFMRKHQKESIRKTLRTVSKGYTASVSPYVWAHAKCVNKKICLTCDKF